MGCGAGRRAAGRRRPERQRRPLRRCRSALRAFPHRRPRQVGVAKISKVLHLKRPGLLPILDSKVMAFYRMQARAAAARYPHRGRRALFWAAIRDDLCANLDSGALPLFRRRLAQSETEHVRRIAALTDVRLLDLLTWAIA
ncbi:DUF6308 family protein [Rhodococcus aetherivorans]